MRKAVVLLRLARAFNQSRQHAIKAVAVHSRRDRVWLEFNAKGPGELELWSLEKEKSYFRDVFGRELLIAAD